MPHAQIGTHSLHYRFEPARSDAAPTLVLSNSIGTDLAMWDDVVTALDGRYAILRYDARGHGQSGADGQPCGIADLGRDVLGLLDHIGRDQAAVCGVSLGGMTALWLGLHAPHRVTHVVAAACAASTETPAFWDARIGTVREHGMQALADGVMARFFSSGFHARQPQVVDSFRQRFIATQPGGYTACCAAIRDLQLDADLPGLGLPVLAIGGTQDAASPAPQSRRIAGLVGNGAYAELDAGHILNVEAPQAFATLLVDFLG